MGRGDVRGLVVNNQAKSIEDIYMRFSGYALLKYDASE